MLHTSDFDFELPSELIASHPLEKRDASRMLVIDPNSPLARGVPVGRGVALSDEHIRDFLDYLRPGDVVVFNNSRVIPARCDARSPLARGVPAGRGVANSPLARGVNAKRTGCRHHYPGGVPRHPFLERRGS